MTNPYLPRSDYDSMAGGLVTPQKSRVLTALANAQAGSRPRVASAGLSRSPAVAAAAIAGAMHPADQFELARGDEALFGMDSGATLIAAGAGGTVFTAPQKPCIPTRMVLSDAMANAFTMSSLTIGVEPVFLTNGVNISLACFTPQSTASEFRAVLCHVGNTISAVITNVSGAPARFITTIYAVPWIYGSTF